MGRLNRHVHRETAPAEFVTLAIAAFDAQARLLGYCSAGHDPPLIVRGDKVDELRSSGLVLGIDPAERYHERDVDLQRGDLLLLYTDGAVDAMDFSGQRFGRERLMQSVMQNAALEPETAIQNILWDIRRFAGLAEQTDDITLVGLRAI
jgi:sigma-B regulation protein RsbU (phosphoserine phosphatase)